MPGWCPFFAHGPRQLDYLVNKLNVYEPNVFRESGGGRVAIFTQNATGPIDGLVHYAVTRWLYFIYMVISMVIIHLRGYNHQPDSNHGDYPNKLGNLVPLIPRTSLVGGLEPWNFVIFHPVGQLSAIVLTWTTPRLWTSACSLASGWHTCIRSHHDGLGGALAIFGKTTLSCLNLSAMDGHCKQPGPLRANGVSGTSSSDEHQFDFAPTCKTAVSHHEWRLPGTHQQTGACRHLFESIPTLVPPTVWHWVACRDYFNAWRLLIGYTTNQAKLTYVQLVWLGSKL